MQRSETPKALHDEARRAQDSDTEEATDEPVVVQNWVEELKRLVPTEES